MPVVPQGSCTVWLIDGRNKQQAMAGEWMTLPSNGMRHHASSEGANIGNNSFRLTFGGISGQADSRCRPALQLDAASKVRPLHHKRILRLHQGVVGLQVAVHDATRGVQVPQPASQLDTDVQYICKRQLRTRRKPSGTAHHTMNTTTETKKVWDNQLEG